MQSEPLDLTAADEVFFTAILEALDTSSGTNFEKTDRFKAELFYTVDGIITTVNLITPWDIGDGNSATTESDPPLGGINGAPDGFINGYRGDPGTDLEDVVTIYATGVEDYDAHLIRDEFNLGMQLASEQLSNVFNLSATIPADAESAYLLITGQGVGGSESIIVRNVLFSTTDTAGDLDQDGIPDDYEASNGLNPNDASDRDLDLDGDGQSNYQEFLAGTAANDASSLLAFTSYQRTGDIVNGTWSSIPGLTYQVQFSTDLQNWADLPGIITGADAPATETATGDLDLAELGTPLEAYFRIRVVQP